MSPRVGWYSKTAWVKAFRPDGLGHIVISGGSEPPHDIVFSEIVCDACNADAGADQADGSEGLIFYDGVDSLCEACGHKAERRLLEEIVASIKKTAFVKGYKATDAEAMGLLVSRYFRWDGLAILRAAYYALEDSNYHAESAKVAAMADNVERGAGPERSAPRGQL
jgi:hypothetical protein